MASSFQANLPKHPKIQIPKLRGENWYSNNGYERKDTLEDNVKIFTKISLFVNYKARTRTMT